MEKKFEKLFEPIKIGPLTINNRLAVAPMNVGLQGPDGLPSEESTMYFAARARGGFGVIISEASSTNPFCAQTIQYNNPRIYSKSHVNPWRNLVDAVHAFGGRFIIQIMGGAGRQGYDPTHQVQSAAPSPIPWDIDPESMPAGLKTDPRFKGHLKGPQPRELKRSEIWQIIESFYTATELAITAGADGVELHCPHGYLGHEFLSPNMNKRTDEFGGSFENRIRYGVECMKEMKRAVKDSYDKVEDKFVIGCRTSCEEHTEGGFTREDMAKFHQALIREGCQFADFSDGPGYEGMKFGLPAKDMMPLKAEYAKFFNERLDIPVMIPSIHDPELAAKVASENDHVIIALGRQSIADPDWPNKVKEGRIKDIVKCLRCNKGCCLPYGIFFEGMSCRCMVNPHMGKEKYQMENWPPPLKLGQYIR